MRISNDLLDTVCGELQDNAKKNTNGKFATFCLNGWSNVANDPIVASSIQVDDIVYIVDIIDTEDQQDGNVPSRRHILGSKIFKEQLLEKFGKKNFFQ